MADEFNPQPEALVPDQGSQPSGPQWSGSGEPSPPAPQSPGGDFRSSLSSRGIDASRFGSDEEAVAYYGRLSPDYVGRLHQMAQMAERMYPYYRQALLAQQQQPTEPAAAQPEPASTEPAKQPYWPAAPEWKQEWLERLTTGPDGQITLKDPMSNPALIEKYQEYRNWQKAALQNLLSDPRGAIKLDERLQEERQAIKQEVQELIQQHYQQQQQQQYATGYLAQNAPWLFQLDPQTGQPAIDPLTGRWAASEDGRDFHYHLSRLSNSPDEQTLADYALLIVKGIQATKAAEEQRQAQRPAGANGNAQQFPSQQIPQQVPFAQQPFLGGGYSPSRGGTVYPSPVSAPQSQAFGKQDVEMGLRNALAARGIT